MLNEILNLMVEKQKLESAYGWVSCFDAPEQYKRMDEIGDELHESIGQLISQYVDGHGVSKFSHESVWGALSTLAFEIKNGNVSEDAEFNLMDQDEFIETYVVGGMDEHAKSVFDSIFYFMDSGHRASWLKANHIDGESFWYTNYNADFVLMVNE